MIRTYCSSVGTSLFADWNESLPFLLSFFSHRFDIAKVRLIFVFTIPKTLTINILTRTENPQVYSTQKKCVPKSFTFSVRISVYRDLIITACSDRPSALEMARSYTFSTGWIASCSCYSLHRIPHSTSRYRNLPHILT